MPIYCSPMLLNNSKYPMMFATDGNPNFPNITCSGLVFCYSDSDLISTQFFWQNKPGRQRRILSQGKYSRHHKIPNLCRSRCAPFFEGSQSGPVKKRRARCALFFNRPCQNCALWWRGHSVGGVRQFLATLTIESNANPMRLALPKRQV